MNDLHDKQCEGQPASLPLEESDKLIQQIHSDWCLASDAKAISRTFKFNNYYETMAFVNVIAMIAHQQDHHPAMCTGYNTCQIEFSTHSLGGLSYFDFICASKVDKIDTL